MTSASLRTHPSDQPLDPEATLVLGAAKGEDGLAVRGTLAADGAFARLAETLAAVGFGGAKDEFVRVPVPAGAAIGGLAVVGLGAGTTDATALRYAAGTAARRTGSIPRIVLDLGAVDAAELTAVAEGAGIGSYDFTEYRGTGTSTEGAGAEGTGSEGAGAVGREIAVVSTLDQAEAEAALERAGAAADAVNLVRDLVNVPALDLYPASYTARVTELTADLPIEVTVWDEEALVAEGFGGIAGVGQGSARPPRLVKLAYAPEGAAKHLALVGKGITFDTGGLSLKPPVSMIGMKYDMAGSATVLAALLAAARLALPVRLTAWLCLAENMPSGTAIRPGDVLTIRGGRTVEVLNTDAEGRLVLADGLVAASEEQPDAIIDVATLTGAAVVALGNRYTAVMGSDELVGTVVAAADETGESVWPMPLPEEMRGLLKSDIADIANVKPGNTAGGMLVAGAFLKDFVGTGASGDPIPWAHLDIAGPAQNKDGGYGYTVKGPTGATVRTLLHIAEGFARA